MAWASRRAFMRWRMHAQRLTAYKALGIKFFPWASSSRHLRLTEAAQFHSWGATGSALSSRRFFGSPRRVSGPLVQQPVAGAFAPGGGVAVGRLQFRPLCWSETGRVAAKLLTVVSKSLA